MLTIYDVLEEESTDGKKALKIAKLLKSDPEAILWRNKKRKATLRHLAVHLRLPKVAVVLLKNGADINAISIDNETPLHVACMYDEAAAIIPWLIENGAEVEAVTNIGFTPLHIAVYRGLSRAVELLLENGADIESSDAEGNTPLGLAASWDQVKVLQLLLEHGADLTARNNDELGGDDLPGSRIIDLARDSEVGSKAAKFLSAMRE